VTWHDDDDSPGRRSASTVERRHPGLFPVLLIAFGASLLLHNIVGHGVSVFPLAIGLFLIARSGGGDHYPLFVIGVVLTGSGIGNLVGDLFGGRDAFGSLGTAAGFFWLATQDPKHRSGWAMVPAAILGLIAVGQFGLHADDVFNGSPGWVLPAGVVVAGVLLLGANRLPGPLRIVGFVFVGAAMLSLLGNNSGTRTRVGRPRVLATVPATESSLDDLAGKTLVATTENGSIIVNPGDEPAVTSTGGRVRVMTTGDVVTVDSTSDHAAFVITVPEGTELKLKTENGAITVNVLTEKLVAESENGAIVVRASKDQSIAATSRNGNVTAPGFDGSEFLSSGGNFVHAGSDGSVVLRTDNGSITVIASQPEPVQAGKT
jgi:hypothetical protein